VSTTLLDTYSISPQTKEPKALWYWSGDHERTIFLGNRRIIEKRGNDGSRQYKIEELVERKKCAQKYVTFQCATCNQTYHFQISCHRRTCPDCAREHADRLFARLCRVLREHPPSGGRRWRFFTLAVATPDEIWQDESGEKVREFVRTAWDAAKKVYRNVIAVRPEWEENICRKVVDKDAGGIITMEFGGKNMNLHFHMLAYCNWVYQRTLSREWERLTGSWYADVRLMQGGVKGLREVCKYICDMNKNGKATKEMIERAMKGSRRVRTLGICYGMPEMGDSEEKKEKRCFRCKDVLRLRYVGIGDMDEDAWQRIVEQAARMEMTIAEMEAMVHAPPT
jgi:hypothetical protein